MIELSGKPGELRMTIQVKRAATGKVEEYELIGHMLPEEPETQEQTNEQRAPE